MAAKAAAKKSAKKSAPKAGGSGSGTDRIIDALAAETAAVGWRNVTMEAVAVRAGLGLGEVLLQAPTKTHLLCGIIDRIDARTLEPVKKIDPADTPRDRLFEILMRRFDALNERRDEAKAVMAGVMRDPAAAIVVGCRLQRSFAAMLAAAGVSTGGLVGLARIQGLKAVTGYALRAWMTDDSEDMAKTMAALDRALERAEKLANFTTLRRSRSNTEDTEAA
jgi:AcrR family transcriptional regulator